MDLQSKKTKVNKKANDLFEFLTKTENFKNVIPVSSDNIEITEDAIKFSMKGMPAIKLAYDEKLPHHTIKLKAVNDMFPVYITCKIQELDDKSSEAQLFLDAEINMMMGMMIKKPLQDLLDTLADKMGSL